MCEFTTLRTKYSTNWEKKSVISAFFLLDLLEKWQLYYWELSLHPQQIRPSLTQVKLGFSFWWYKDYIRFIALETAKKNALIDLWWSRLYIFCYKSITSFQFFNWNDQWLHLLRYSNLQKSQKSTVMKRRVFPVRKFSQGRTCFHYSSDRPKQCFTILSQPNRTSQLKFCFPNRNRTEPNM